MAQPRIHANRAAKQKAYRDRHRTRRTVPDLPRRQPKNPALALRRWAASTLVVPPGHPAAGRPMRLPAFAVDFLRGALADDRYKALLCCARKNAKSAICAVLALGYLAGPLRVEGWKGAVASLNRTKAGLLLRQCEAIAQASKLEGLAFMRVPYPGRIVGPHGELTILSADRGAGHAESLDLVLCDETGLMFERDREMLASLVSSTSAKDGRVIHLSIRGDGPFVPELLQDADVFRMVYAAPDRCEVNDRAAWGAANPGLGTIKSVAYMAREARAAAAVPANERAFRAHDLNQAVSPSRELICSQSDWAACVRAEGDLPPRSGPCAVGFDAGQSASMTAAVAYWPATGRLEAWCGLPATPDLMRRGHDDAVGDLYVRMEARGDLKLYGGRVTPVGSFLADVSARLEGEHVIAFGADRVREKECLQACEAAGVRWPWHRRGTGAAKHADGSHDIRAFQRQVLSARLATRDNLALEHAVCESDIRYDGAGNPALDKARQASRIDALQAGVIAVGLGVALAGRRRSRAYLGRT